MVPPRTERESLPALPSLQQQLSGGGGVVASQQEQAEGGDGTGVVLPGVESGGEGEESTHLFLSVAEKELQPDEVSCSQ